MAVAQSEPQVELVFDGYYTLKDAATILGMKWRTLGVQIRRGEVKAKKVASVWLLHVDEIERLQRRKS